MNHTAPKSNKTNILPIQNLKLLIWLLPIVLFSSCVSLDEKYGLVDMFHNKPVQPRAIPRATLGELPSGAFRSHQIKGIMIMDTGADYDGETSVTYIRHLLKRYEKKHGGGDFPFHFFIDSTGKIFVGRQETIPAELHKEDSFTFRSDDIPQEDILLKRLSRRSKERMNLDGFITIALLGNYDKSMVSEKQEKSLFQLVSFLAFRYYIPIDHVISLKDKFPETRNPGFYLDNYLKPSILEANIPPIPVKPGFLVIPEENS
jgi:N-acetylmuramoyl-L-alanine amidase-like protein